MKKLLCVTLIVLMIGSLATLSLVGAESQKIDLTALVGDPSRINPDNGATRMMGWDPNSDVIEVSNSYEDQWVGGTGKGYLIDGQIGPANFATGSAGLFVSAKVEAGTIVSGNASVDTPAYFILNLGQEYSLDKFVFYPLFTAADAGNTGFPKDFTIQVSKNGTDWTTVVSRTDFLAVADQVNYEFTFTAVNANYIKFAATEIASPVLGLGGAGNDLALTEIEVYGGDPIADPTPTEAAAPTEATVPTEATTPDPTATTAPQASYVNVLANGKLDLTPMLGGLSGTPALVGWDADEEFIKVSKSFEVGWVNGYGKGFLIDGVVGNGQWPVSAGQFVAAALDTDQIHVKNKNSTQNINEFVEIDLQTAFKLNKFAFTGIFLDTAAKQAGVPSDFTIQVSKDGTNWTTVVTKTGYAPESGSLWNEFSFAKTEARYIRLLATKAPIEYGDTNEFGYTIAFTELAIYGEELSGTSPQTSDNAQLYLVMLTLIAAAVSVMIIRKKVRQ